MEEHSSAFSLIDAYPTNSYNQSLQLTNKTNWCRHGVVRVEECESDLYAAVDLVSDKLKRKLVKVGGSTHLPASRLRRVRHLLLPPPPPRPRMIG